MLHRQINSHVRNTWKTNVTLLVSVYGICATSIISTFLIQDKAFNNNPHWCPTGWPGASIDPFFPLRSLEAFNNYIHDDNSVRISRTNRRAYAASATLFEDVAEALKALEGQVRLEVICGGVLEELQKMQVKADTARPAEFPRTFTRVWMSNVP